MRWDVGLQALRRGRRSRWRSGPSTGFRDGPGHKCRPRRRRAQPPQRSELKGAERQATPSTCRPPPRCSSRRRDTYPRRGLRRNDNHSCTAGGGIRGIRQHRSQGGGTRPAARCSRHSEEAKEGAATQSPLAPSPGRNGSLTRNGASDAEHRPGALPAPSRSPQSSSLDHRIDKQP